MRVRVRRLGLVTLAVGLVALGPLGAALSDAGGSPRHAGEGRSQWPRARADVAPVLDPTYAAECGSCHMAYQPGLLPALAWARIMDPAALAEHFGDDASLPAETVNAITTYLTPNGADQGHGQRAHAFAVGAPGLSGPDGALPRITESAYFRRKHQEIPERMVSANPEVGSFSQCNRCHQGAGEGVYNEDQVRIPGFGSWED